MKAHDYQNLSFLSLYLYVGIFFYLFTTYLHGFKFVHKADLMPAIIVCLVLPCLPKWGKSIHVTDR